MSRAGALSAKGSGAILEVIPLDYGWEAVGVPHAATDERLSNVESSLVPARVPGTAAMAVGSAGGDADLDEQDWWFRLRFAAPLAEPGTETVIHFGGIATLADVWLNGEHVLRSENMHVAHAVGVDGLLAPENELVIGVRALASELVQRRPRPRWRTRMVRDQALRWFRTSLLGRAPGLGAGPAPVGLWRPVALERRRRLAVDSLRTRTALEDGTGAVSVEARVRALGSFRLAGASLVVDGPSGSHVSELDAGEENDVLVLTGTLRIPEVEPWWPHTHGTPALYDAHVSVRGSDAETIELDCGPLGFRSLTGAPGSEEGLIVNGVPVFCRGASLMPSLESADVAGDVLRRLVDLACDAGMNLLRLSGVWSYGSDELFALCDRRGVLVWQDFPFANLDYPIGDAGFRAEVERECRGFLQSVGHHPSLAVLCGNSEVEQQVGMLGLAPDLARSPLFDELLPSLVREEQIDAAYVPSSPSGGDLAFRSNEGVAHYFGVGAYRRPLDDARRTGVRFAAECLAFANVPSEDLVNEIVGAGAAAAGVHSPTWKSAVPRDAGTAWDFEDIRDHYLQLYYDVDPAEVRQTDPDRYVELSRVVSGEVMADVLGEWRRGDSPCRGALIWWFNDPKPSMGWGIVDCRPHTKAAYWFVRRAFAPIAIWMTDEGTNGVAIHLANDADQPLAATVEVALYRDHEIRLDAGTEMLEVPPRAVLERNVEGVLGHFADASYAFRFGPPSHDLVVATLRSGDELVSEAFFFPLGRPVRRESIDTLGFTAKAARGGDGSLLLTLESKRFAHAVSLDVPGHRASDDFVSVAPGGRRTITLWPLDAQTILDGHARPLNAHGAARIELQES